jgi:energy-coupling factor transporter transmembrane protein EcfT
VGSIKSIKILVSIKNYTVTVILTSFLVLCVIFVVCHFVVFLLTIVMSVRLLFTDSDYPFGFFKFFLTNVLIELIFICMLASSLNYEHNVSTSSLKYHYI